MSPSIVAATSKAVLQEIEMLAIEIWQEHYTPIIGSAQVAYMLYKFQSFAAMDRQIKEEGYLYYAIYQNDNLVGYFAVQPRAESLFLSKLYVASNMRGLGIAKLAMSFIKDLATTKNLEQIELTVNKYNKDSIAAYNKMGFITVKEAVFDIGEGFVMDDYVMQLDLNS